MASASSPLAETPNTAVRPTGSATPKRVRTQLRTSSTKNLSCAANRSGSKPGEYSCSRSVSSARRCAPTIIVDGTSAASRTRPHCEISWPSPANTTASGGSGGTYTVTSRPPLYSNVSVMNSPGLDTVDVSSSLAALPSGHGPQRSKSHESPFWKRLRPLVINFDLLLVAEDYIHRGGCGAATNSTETYVRALRQKARCHEH